MGAFCIQTMAAELASGTVRPSTLGSGIRQEQRLSQIISKAGARVSVCSVMLIIKQYQNIYAFIAAVPHHCRASILY